MKQQCHYCDTPTEPGKAIVCLDCASGSVLEIIDLRIACKIALDALGCDRTREERLHAQELIHKATK